MAKRKNKKIIVKRNRLKGNTATANRKYKDTVFRMLFSDRKNLLSLYKQSMKLLIQMLLN